MMDESVPKRPGYKVPLKGTGQRGAVFLHLCSVVGLGGPAESETQSLGSIGCPLVCDQGY